MEKRVEGESLNIGALIEENPNLKELQIYTVRKPEFKKLQGLDQIPLEKLEIRWFSGSDLSAIPLPPTLKYLKIWHCGKLRSLDGIEACPLLETLIYDDNCPLENSTSLTALTKLKELELSGGRGSSYKVSSIAAIENLPIEKLTMFAIDGKDLDLTPITRLSKLRELDIFGPCFKPAELAKVAAAFPWFLEKLFDLNDYTLHGFGCKKCNGIQKEMFLRGKKSLWCPVCNQAGIDRILSDFLELVKEAEL